MPSNPKPKRAKKVSVKAWGIYMPRCKIPRVIYPQRFVTRGYMDWKAGEAETVRQLIVTYSQVNPRKAKR